MKTTRCRCSSKMTSEKRIAMMETELGDDNNRLNCYLRYLDIMSTNLLRNACSNCLFTVSWWAQALEFLFLLGLKCNMKTTRYSCSSKMMSEKWIAMMETELGDDKNRLICYFVFLDIMSTNLLHNACSNCLFTGSWWAQALEFLFLLGLHRQVHMSWIALKKD